MRKKLWLVLLLLAMLLSLPACGGKATPAPRAPAAPTPVGKPTKTWVTKGAIVQDWCTPGASITLAGMGQVTTVGKENHVVGGRSVQMCCYEGQVSSSKGGGKFRICKSQDDGYSIQWLYQEGKYVKTAEVYLQGGQVCSKMFDPQGNVVMESCR